MAAGYSNALSYYTYLPPTLTGDYQGFKTIPFYFYLKLLKCFYNLVLSSNSLSDVS